MVLPTIAIVFRSRGRLTWPRVWSWPAGAIP